MATKARKVKATRVSSDIPHNFKKYVRRMLYLFWSKDGRMFGISGTGCIASVHNAGYIFLRNVLWNVNTVNS